MQLKLNKERINLIITLVCCYYVTISVVSSIEVEKEITISYQEKQALDLLKMRLASYRTPDWMKSDLALIRWLRIKNLNIQQAETAFIEMVKWRKENAIDSILDEDWSYFKQNYYMDEEGTDYAGRPVVACDISEWDVRKAVVAGKGDGLVRYMIRGIEAVASRIRNLQAMGGNVTQWQVILNMDSFSVFQHACLQCLPIYLRFISAHEAYFPFGADKIIILNTPAAFEVVLGVVRPVMSTQMRDSVTVFGSNKAEWRKVVLSLIPPDQLAEHFGGTKPSSF